MGPRHHLSLRIVFFFSLFHWLLGGFKDKRIDWPIADSMGPRHVQSLRVVFIFSLLE